MIRGEINNCEKCGQSYGQYNLTKENDFSEYHCVLPYYENGEIKKPKGCCQFCNPKSNFYIKGV